MFIVLTLLTVFMTNAWLSVLTFTACVLPAIMKATCILNLMQFVLSAGLYLE